MTSYRFTTPDRLIRNYFVFALQAGVFIYSVAVPAPARAQSMDQFLQGLNQQMSQAMQAYKDGMRIGNEGRARQRAEREELLRRARLGDERAAEEYNRRIDALNRHAIEVWGAAANQAEKETQRTKDYYHRQWQQDYHNYLQSRDWALQQGYGAARRGDLDGAAKYAPLAEYYGQKAYEYRSR